MPTKKLKGTDYIYERITADGRLTSYQVKIRRKGFPDHNASFDDLEEAKAFVRQVLHDQDKGHRIDRLAGHRTSVGQVVDDAIDDLVSGRRKIKGVRDELYRLRAFRRREALLCSTAMADLTEDQFDESLRRATDTALKPASLGHHLATRMAVDLASETGAKLLAVQHHHAHLASCLAAHGRPMDAPPVLGVVLDGLGLGEDGTIWGGEFLLGDYRSFRRLAHFDPVAMPGGDMASLEPWRNTHAHLARAFGPGYLAGAVAGLPLAQLLAGKPLPVLDRMIERRINAPLASSAGRLFDACAAILGVCFERQSYEGQAGMELEALAGPFFDAAEAWPVSLPPADPVIRWRGLWEAVLGDLGAGVAPGPIAARFHRTLVALASQTAMRLARQNRVDAVALSGGVFQNRLLLEGMCAALAPTGFEVITHGSIPANDGGLALG